MRHLRLTELQEKNFITFLKKRLKELDRDNRERIDQDKQSDLDYRNSVNARAKIGTVYAESNMPVPLTCMVVDHFATQGEEQVFGRSPFATFDPEGPADTELTRGLNRFSQFKLFKMAKCDQSMMDSSHSFYRHRAMFMKAIYDEDVDVWEEHEVPVLFDRADNLPVLLIDHGNVIQDRDRWVPTVDPLTGGITMAHEKDPTLVFDPSRHFYQPSPLPIKFRNIRYAGAKSLEVDSDCIRIPSTCRCLDEADIIAEYYDKPSHWARSRFYQRPWMDWARFEGLTRNSNASRKTKDQRKEQAQGDLSFDIDNVSLGIVEVWVERDVLGWGTPQRFVAWMDTKTDTLIDYEYQKLVTPHGRHPYSAVAIARKNNSWWGYSLPEMMKPFQEYVDLQWNRHSFRNSINSNPIIAQNPDAIQEKKSFLELRPFDLVTLEQGKTIQDWLQAFVFPQQDNDTQELLKQALEWVKFWLGISDISRGDYSDVPQNTTLGGQEASLKKAGNMSRRWSRRLKAGAEDHLTKLVDIMLVTMNPEEAYTYLEGDVSQMAFFSQSAVKDMRINAKISIGKESSTQDIQEQQLTLQTIKEYFTFPPQLQAVIRPVMKRILFMLGHDDVDSLLPVPMMPAIDPMTGQQVMVPVPAGMPVPPPQSAPSEDEQVEPDENVEQPAAEEEAQPVAPAPAQNVAA